MDIGDGSDGRLAGALRDQWPRAKAALTGEGRTQAGAALARQRFEQQRNYDFDPDEVQGVIARSRFLRPVIGMLDSGWGPARRHERRRSRGVATQAPTWQ